MNIYVLVEGRVTEMQVYARWIPYLIPQMSQAARLSEVRDNNFYMFSGYGYPSILRRIAGTVNDINRHGNIDYLLICLDSEEESVEQRYKVIMRRFSMVHEKLHQRTKIKVIVHHRCMETWFLGNTELEKVHISNRKLLRMIDDYNVFKLDPEKLVANMNILVCRTSAQYHYSYLKHLFNENHINYTKKNPGRTLSRSYLNQLIRRSQETGHIPSFAYFVKFCRRINKEIG